MENEIFHTHPMFNDVQIGIGTWAWGDRYMWGFGHGYGEKDLEAVYDISAKAGIYLFDTAEVYGQGKSEIFLGKFHQIYNQKQTAGKIKIATKFMPYPWRLSRGSLLKAIKGSLKRLSIHQIALYQIHVPLPPVSIEKWMEGMVEAVHNGSILAAGVSNFDRQQMQRAYDALGREGVQLASNQVEYNLLNRRIEKNGLLKHCSELGVKVIAYSPIAMGILSGKYTPNSLPSGLRSRKFSRNYLEEIQPIISLLKKIGSAHAGKTPAQVAINWTLCKGTLPIPGAKNLHQTEQIIGSIGWHLSEEEINLLDEASDRIHKT